MAAVLTVVEEAHKTDTGRQRHTNEDSYFAREPVFVVADGMGGAQAGEVASRIAAGTFEAGLPSEPEGPEAQLRELILEANKRIHDLAQEDSARAGMGTTLTAALIDGGEISFGHVGDSRAYLLRDGELKRLTNDHSLVEELRRQGRLTDEEAEEHPQRSIITRALGPEPDVEVDTFTHQARDGDIYLLCSDGLTTMIGEPEVREILGSGRSLRWAVGKLVDAANAKGGRDNITAIAFRIGVEGEVLDQDATLIDRTAGQAGITAERMRAAADRFSGRSPMPDPRRRRGAKLLVSVLLLGLIAVGATLFVRTIHFLGVDDGGRVTLYRGLPYELPAGIELYSEQRSIPVPAAELSPERQDVVTDHRLRSKGDAEDLLADIEANEGSKPVTPPQDGIKKQDAVKQGSNDKATDAAQPGGEPAKADQKP